jgi:hypothetical protein
MKVNLERDRMKLPEYLSQGDAARLFPVLATTSKEGRTTSIFLASLANITEFRDSLLATLGVKTGKRTTMDCFTEVVFAKQKMSLSDRPDGLIVVSNGQREWRALVETKVGSNPLNADQIERYRALAKENNVDCVLTISNQFTSLPTNHPISEVRKAKSKTPVYHWSWMHIFTQADLLLANKEVQDDDQFFMLAELRRFLAHESAGIKGFDRMPVEWTELNRLVSAGGKIGQKSVEAETVLGAWFQETKDLSLILTRQTEAKVTERISRKLRDDVTAREKEGLEKLSKARCLEAEFDIPNAAAGLVVTADISRRTIDVGMRLRAPTDKKSSKARVNWLLRQVGPGEHPDLHVRLLWPGRSEDTQFAFSELKEAPEICEAGKETVQVLAFHIFYSRRLGSRFTQQVNFITDLETVVPEFYLDIGQKLTEWRPAAAKIKTDRQTAEDVSVDAIENMIDD